MQTFRWNMELKHAYHGHHCTMSCCWCKIHCWLHASKFYSFSNCFLPFLHNLLSLSVWHTHHETQENLKSWISFCNHSMVKRCLYDCSYGLLFPSTSLIKRWIHDPRHFPRTFVCVTFDLATTKSLVGNILNMSLGKGHSLKSPWQNVVMGHFKCFPQSHVCSVTSTCNLKKTLQTIQTFLINVRKINFIPFWESFTLIAVRNFLTSINSKKNEMPKEDTYYKFNKCIAICPSSISPHVPPDHWFLLFWKHQCSSIWIEVAPITFDPSS